MSASEVFLSLRYTNFLIIIIIKPCIVHYSGQHALPGTVNPTCQRCGKSTSFTQWASGHTNFYTDSLPI